MHVLTPAVMDLLAERAGRVRRAARVALAGAGRAGAPRAVPRPGTAGRRYDIGVRYGFFAAQLALALDGGDREEVLAQLVELLAQRETASEPESGPAS